MKHDKKRSQQHAAPTQSALYVAHSAASPADPEGSYTDRPADPFVTPQQDAEDL